MERMNIVTTEDPKKFKDELLCEFKTLPRANDVLDRFGIGPGTRSDDAEEIDLVILENQVKPNDRKP